MQYTTLGRSGLKVSRLVLGTMNFGDYADEKESFRIMDCALEAGINCFDSADFYGAHLGHGETESLIGRWLAQGGRREKIVLATKVYATMGPGVNDRGLSAYHLRRGVRQCMQRLQTDHIDLLQFHHVDRGVRSLQELKNIHLGRDVAFITTQELEDLYPELTAKQRENAFANEHGTVCIMQIGGKLRSGKPHDGRAPDYDDWALNCDILFWHKPLGCALELSSMGIRVDAESLRRQLDEAGCPERAELPFHKMLLDGTLPLTMGGGIGQSRLCMLLLGKAHVGEVQVSLWDDATVKACRNAGVELL